MALFVNTKIENEKHCYHTLCAESSSPSKYKSHWLKNKTEKHFRVPLPLSKVLAVPNHSESLKKKKKKVPWGAMQGLLSLCWSFQHLQCIVAALTSGDPSVSTPNTIQSKEAIKIPSCRKKPLRRVDARRLLANMKRRPAPHCFSVCTHLSGSLQRLTQKLSNIAGTNSFFIVFGSSEASSHLSGIRGTWTGSTDRWPKLWFQQMELYPDKSSYGNGHSGFLIL